MKKSELRISRKEVRIILDYLEDHNEFLKGVPKEYRCLNGVTNIRGGFKTISVAKIEYIAKRLGYKSW